jgi:hypothetical protein
MNTVMESIGRRIGGLEMNLTILSEPDPAEDTETPRRFGLIAGILCFCFFFAAGVLSISQSKSSTAAVGYVFLPFYAAIMSVLAFLAGWCVGYFLVWYRSPAKTGRISAIAAALVPVILVILVGWALTTLSHRRDGVAVTRLAARDANTAPNDLEKLAAGTNEYVLGDVAGNPKLSEATLRKLANRGGYLVDWGLARNRSTPRDILSRLAGSANEYTRMYVAANPNAPAEVLADLSKDGMRAVRLSVAQNPSTPRGTIDVLLRDADETVRRLADAAMARH